MAHNNNNNNNNRHNNIKIYNQNNNKSQYKQKTAAIKIVIIKFIMYKNRRNTVKRLLTQMKNKDMLDLTLH